MEIIKRKIYGKINNIVYNNTFYNKGLNRRYLKVDELYELINEIIKLRTTTDTIYFNLFYRNEKLGFQIEFDKYLFFMECVDFIDEEEYTSYLSISMNSTYDVKSVYEKFEDMSDEKKEMALTLLPICLRNDYINYEDKLLNYIDYLDKLIPVLFSEIIQEYNLSSSDIAFGHFCFEVYST